MRTFGDWAQSVLSLLTYAHDWDDPYAAMTPAYDPEGAMLTALYERYQKGMDVSDAAKEIEDWRSNEP